MFPSFRRARDIINNGNPNICKICNRLSETKDIDLNGVEHKHIICLEAGCVLFGKKGTTCGEDCKKEHIRLHTASNLHRISDIKIDETIRTLEPLKAESYDSKVNYLRSSNQDWVTNDKMVIDSVHSPRSV